MLLVECSYLKILKHNLFGGEEKSSIVKIDYTQKMFIGSYRVVGKNPQNKHCANSNPT